MAAFCLMYPWLLSLISILVTAAAADTGDNDDVLHLNTNDFFNDNNISVEMTNDSLTRPQLMVTVDYELPHLQEDDDSHVSDVNNNDDYEDTGDDDVDSYLSLDSYTIHVPKFHPQVTIQSKLKQFQFGHVGYE